ncbi:hypothetical protein WL76_12480 [Burkholderia ubonensis]|nr:hypothetical protein WL76_12480 [Burkholderia ubonensis]
MSSGVFVTQSATISFIAQNVQSGRLLASGLYYMAYYGGGFLGGLDMWHCIHLWCMAWHCGGAVIGAGDWTGYRRVWDA